jgi:ribosomal protein S18 acetylase RimI-like enzyme
MVGIALGEVKRWNSSLWVWELHVVKAYRGQGIGGKLVEATVQAAKQLNLRVVVCETQNTNVPAIDFYSAVGFELDGIDLSYYSNHDLETGEVALFMKRKIASSGEEQVWGY